MMRSPPPPTQNYPRVGVALASRNGDRYIETQIRSILWQRAVHSVVLVRDDGSQDATVAIVRRLAEEWPERIRLIDDGHGPSGSAAQNFFRLIEAIDPEEFDHVALSDQDDIWEEEKLARAVGELQRSGADGYSSNLLSFDVVTGDLFPVRKDWPQTRFDHLFQTASAGCTYVMTNLLVRVMRDQLLANAPNPDIAHDILLYAIARSHGFSWIHDREAHILYRQHSGNLVGARGGWRGHLARLRLIRSGWYRKQVTALAPYLSGRGDEQRMIAAVRRSSWRDRAWLAARAHMCRRRASEAVVFALAQVVP